MTTMRRARILLGFGFSLLAACSTRSTDHPTGGKDPASFTMSASPAALSIQAGQSGTAVVTLARTNFTGAIDIAATAPSGLTVTVTGSPVSGTSASVQVSVAAATAVGNYTVVLSGTGTGVTQQSINLVVTVTAAPGGMTLAVAPTPISVAQGQTSANVTATIARTGSFAGAASITVSGLPSGVTATPSTFTIAAGATTGTFTLSAATGATVATSGYAVTASASGITAASASPQVTVTAAVTALSFRFCDNFSIVWFAVQDGNGAWTRVLPTGNAFNFTLNSAVGGVAYRYLVNSSGGTEIRFSSRAELVSAATPDCSFQTGTKTLNGSVAGFTAGTHAVDIRMGGGTASPAAPGSFTVTGVRDGAQDLLATRTAVATLAPDRLILRRGLNQASGSALAPLDFGSAEALAPATATFTIGNIGSDSVFTFLNGFVSTDGTNLGAYFTFTPSLGNTRTMYGLAAAQQQVNDLNFARVITSTSSATYNANTRRDAFAYFRGFGDRTVTLGDYLSPPTVTAISGGVNARVRATGVLNAPYTGGVSLLLFPAGAAGSVYVSATSAYLGGSTYDISIPDFSAVPGWLASYGLTSGVQVGWSITGASASFVPADGLVQYLSSRGGSITP
jgi:hypothetical protein